MNQRNAISYMYFSCHQLQEKYEKNGIYCSFLFFGKKKRRTGAGEGLTNEKAASRIFIRFNSPSPVSPNPIGLI